MAALRKTGVHVISEESRNFWLRGNFSTVGINHIRNASMVTEVVGVPWALRLIVSRGGPPVGPIHSKNSGLPAAQFRENT